MPLYLTRFISRAKLSVKTVQLLRLPLTSDAACPPARRPRDVSGIMTRALAFGKSGSA
jgi:hypothetical protein